MITGVVTTEGAFVFQKVKFFQNANKFFFQNDFFIFQQFFISSFP